MKQTTLCYSMNNGRVLLALKKRGVGEGLWNGPGGKREEGETIFDTCIRETQEEIGVKVEVLEHRGIVTFSYESKPEWETECHIFVAQRVIGNPVETEEMVPCWFDLASIPYTKMWEDDPYWLPAVLRGSYVRASFSYNAMNALIRHEVSLRTDPFSEVVQ